MTPLLRILVVDDHGDSARALARLLAHLGHEAVTASSARDAITAAGGARFDVLVSDISLPDLDGCELLRRLRARSGDLLAIAVSGCDDAATAQACRRAGYQSFLLKPVVFEELTAALDDVWAGRPMPPHSRAAVPHPPAADQGFQPRH